MPATTAPLGPFSVRRTEVELDADDLARLDDVVQVGHPLEGEHWGTVAP